ncbi:MAG: PDZ domain-containing protein, partial [Planctomycetales bacterium]|nr:PDZ domain-containing protein [Planctomycetales bacterium]
KMDVGKTSIPITFSGGYPYAKCKVNDQELTMLVDTGWIGTATIQELLMKSVAGETQKANTGTRISEAYRARCPTLAVGDYVLHEVVVGQHPKKDILGIHFFARFKTTFDFPGKKMYLQPGRSYSGIDRTDHDGVFISDRIRGDGKRVDSVVKNSIAERQGILPGDVITEIDGKPIKDLPQAVVYRRWSQRDKAEMKLQLRRGEASMTVVLPAEPKE